MSLLKDTLTAAGWAAGALALGMGLALAIAGPADAGGRMKERVYDDSFGNLIIISPAGYKRIVVGMGHIAAEYQAAQRPEIVYGEGHDRPAYTRHCHQPPVLWKGRGYMYGLADGEIPTPPVVCE
jgi:hypothetical protein